MLPINYSENKTTNCTHDPVSYECEDCGVEEHVRYRPNPEVNLCVDCFVDSVYLEV